jgi:hypothetical protein
VWGTVAPNKAVKLAVGEWLVWWASSNEYGQPTLSPAARCCDYVGVSVGALSSYKFTELTTELVAAITPALPEQPAFKHHHD